MTGIPLRGLSETAVERIDAEAASLGLLRNELLRWKLEGNGSIDPGMAVTRANRERSALALEDLADPTTMSNASR